MGSDMCTEYEFYAYVSCLHTHILTLNSSTVYYSPLWSPLLDQLHCYMVSTGHNQIKVVGIGATLSE